MLEAQGISIAIHRLDGTHKTEVVLCQRILCKKFHLTQADLTGFTMRRRSIDARKKNDIHLTYTVRFNLAGGSHAEEALLKRVSPKRGRITLKLVDEKEPQFPTNLGIALPKRPCVIGAGCAGLFCALTLAEAGLSPLLIERGDDATRRTESVETFNETGTLNPESNIQFGLGGAGTFSDGKLNTGTKNPLHRLILQTFVEAGAPKDILYNAKPHIGSDILPAVVTHLAERIEDAGGTVLFNTKLLDIELTQNRSLCGVSVRRGNGREETIHTSHTILACGHSARDVFSLLAEKGVILERKTFAMGVRIEHLQSTIDRAQYGPEAGNPVLGAAPYKLVAHPKEGRSAFSFCMCPGGSVVAASSEMGGVCTNGQSLAARSGTNANSGLLVNVFPDDLVGDDPLAAIELQRSCERKAYELGDGAYRAPAQLVGDFLAARPSSGPGSVKPTYPRGVAWGEIDGCLPSYITDTLRLAIPLLGHRLHRFDEYDAVLTAPETRSSSPVRVVRTKEGQSANTSGLWPCGEGAGYAGGIMSAATDGIRIAQRLIDTLAH